MSVKNSDNEISPISRGGISILLIITALGFPLLGWGIATATNIPFWEMFTTQFSQWSIALGLIIGFISAILGYWLINTKFLNLSNTRLFKIIQKIASSWIMALFISLCAGFGEEILFRGVLQSLWGIYITSFVFVFIHGYLNPLKPKMSFYGIFLIFVSVAFGYLHEYFGIFSAIAAHAAYDFLLLRFTARQDK